MNHIRFTDEELAQAARQVRDAHLADQPASPEKQPVPPLDLTALQAETVESSRASLLRRIATAAAIIALFFGGPLFVKADALTSTLN